MSMFSEDKFNELVKNLKAGKDVPTPQPEPVRKKRSKPAVVHQRKPQPQSRKVNDIGGWLNEVDDLKGQLAKLDVENRQLKTEKETLQKELSSLKRMAESHETKPDLAPVVAALKKELSVAENQLEQTLLTNKELVETTETMRVELNAHQNQPSPQGNSEHRSLIESTGPALKSLLQARGLQSVDEMRSVVSTLLSYPPFFDRYLASDFHISEIQHLLNTELCLSAVESEDLSLPLLVKTPPSRCEIGGGHNIDQAVRSLIDAMLVYGKSKLMFVSLHTKEIQLLRHFVQHHALDVLCIAESDEFDLNRMLLNFPEQQLMIRWHFDQGQEDSILGKCVVGDQRGYSVSASSLYGLLMVVANDIMDNV